MFLSKLALVQIFIWLSCKHRVLCWHRLASSLQCRCSHSSVYCTTEQAQQAEQRKVEEAAERVTLMEQYAANDRVEQLSAQRARLRVAQHRRAIEALLAAKREAFEQEQASQVLSCLQWCISKWNSKNSYFKCIISGVKIICRQFCCHMIIHTSR